MDDTSEIEDKQIDIAFNAQTNKERESTQQIEQEYLGGTKSQKQEIEQQMEFQQEYEMRAELQPYDQQVTKRQKKIANCQALSNTTIVLQDRQAEFFGMSRGRPQSCSGFEIRDDDSQEDFSLPSSRLLKQKKQSNTSQTNNRQKKSLRKNMMVGSATTGDKTRGPNSQKQQQILKVKSNLDITNSGLIQSNSRRSSSPLYQSAVDDCSNSSSYSHTDFDDALGDQKFENQFDDAVSNEGQKLNRIFKKIKQADNQINKSQLNSSSSLLKQNYLQNQKEIDQGLRKPTELLRGIPALKNVSREKVIHHKMICYISSFHLNVNDWFNEYENIEIFNIQLLSKLGNRWAESFEKAVKSPFDSEQDEGLGDSQINVEANDIDLAFAEETPSTVPQINPNGEPTGNDTALTADNEYYQLMFNLYLITCYQATNIAEAYMTQQHLQATKILKNQEKTFEIFFNEAFSFTGGKGYQILDISLFKDVVRSFYFYAQNEYENILVKIETDQRSKINFTEKALQQFNEIQRKEAMKEREKVLNEKIKTNSGDTGKGAKSSEEQKRYFGLNVDNINRYGQNIPGFQMLKNSILKPIIVATEKYVEYYQTGQGGTSPPALDENLRDNADASIKSGDQSDTLSEQDPQIKEQPSLDCEPENEANPLQSQIPFNLSLKFSRLQITEVDNMPMSVDSQSIGKAQSHVLDQRSQSSVSKSPQIGGLRRKKRTFRELERWQIFKEDPNQRSVQHLDLSQADQEQDSKSQTTRRHTKPKDSDCQSLKTLKFNSQLLQKASAAVDLISQKIEFKNLMNQSVTGSFVTVILELTNDFIDKLEKQEQHIIQQQVQLAQSTSGETPENLNIKFIKPSPHFYNKIMSLWFKFNHMQTGRNQENITHSMTQPQLRAQFLEFCIKQFKQVGSWHESLLRPLDNFINIITNEHCHLQSQALLECQSSSDDGDESNLNQILSKLQKVTNQYGIDTQQYQQRRDSQPKQKYTAMSQHMSMCNFFDNIKSQLMKQWEVEIVQKGSRFTVQKQQVN